MPPAEFFTSFGFYVDRHFITEGDAARLIADIGAAPSEPALVGDYVFRVDQAVRKTSYAHPPEGKMALISDRLRASLPTVARQFNVAITGFEPPKCLVYDEGDFFREHDDALSGHGLPPRQVSVVIFLSGPEAYRGGELTFYALFDEPQWRHVGFPLVGEAGSLIAFRPHLRHEVTPVTSGRRFTVVTWYY